MTSLPQVESIRTMITAALGMVDQLGDDGLLVGLATILQRVLPEDREALMDVLDHLVSSRVLVESDNMWVRFMPRPDPFARLYERAGAPRREPSLPYEEALHAARVGARLALRLPPRPPGGWRPSEATLAAARALTPDERAFVIAATRNVQERLRARRKA